MDMNTLSSLVPIFQKNMQLSAYCGSESNLANLYSTGARTVHSHHSEDHNMHSTYYVSNMHSRMITIPDHQQTTTVTIQFSQPSI
jgi:hypothetical protein